MLYMLYMLYMRYMRYMLYMLNTHCCNIYHITQSHNIVTFISRYHTIAHRCYIHQQISRNCASLLHLSADSTLRACSMCFARGHMPSNVLLQLPHYRDGYRYGNIHTQYIYMGIDVIIDSRMRILCVPNLIAFISYYVYG